MFLGDDIARHRDSWVHIWVTNCLKLGRKDSGKISMSGMVTLLAEAVHERFPKMRRVILFSSNSVLLSTPGIHETAPTNVYNFQQLQKSSMLWSPLGHNVYIWLFGAHNVKYMLLPQPERTRINANTTHVQLVIPPDENYRAGVEEEYG